MAGENDNPGGNTGENAGGNPPAAVLSADPNFAKLNPAIQGAFKNKGWDSKTAFEAAVEAMNSYQEAEKFLGAPKDLLVRLPKDATDVEGRRAFNARIGVPEKPEGYDLTGVKFADGSELDEGFTTALRTALHSEHVPASAAPAIAKALVAYMESAETAETAAAQATLQEQRDALAKEWGAAKDAQLFLAKQAILKLGLNENVINTLEQSAGYAETMKALATIGKAMGEDKFIADPSGGVNRGVMTPAQAEARLGELKRDAMWVQKVNAGDHAANKEFNDLTRIMVGAA